MIKPGMSSRAVFLVFPLLLSAQAPSAVRGKVLSMSGAPVAQAGVTLVSTNHGANRYTTNADSEGNFLFDNVQPDTYYVRASQTGFVTPGPLTWVVVSARRRSPALELILAQQAVLEGRVTQPGGDPEPQAKVQLTPLFRGECNLDAPAAQTDAYDGRFAFSGIRPGKYCLNVNANSASGNLAYPAIFYPGTVDRRQARIIQVVEGAQLRDLNIELTTARAYHVRGSVRLPEDTDRHPAISVTIRRKEEKKFSPWIHAPVQVGPDGCFDLSGILPGTYAVLAETILYGEPRSTEAEIAVTDLDVDDVTLSYDGGIPLDAEIHALHPPAGFDAGQVSLTLTTLTGALAGISQPGEDGMLTIPDVPPGRYRIRASVNKAAGYVKSIEFNGRAITGDDLVLAPEDSEATLRITVAFNLSQIAGVVRNAAHAPVPGAPVRYYRKAEGACGCEKLTTTDRQGRFLLRLLPGEYRIIAKFGDEDDFTHAARVVAAPGRSKRVKIPLTD